METNLYNRVVATLLAIATVGLGLFAIFNLQQEGQYQQPDDGVTWTETQSTVLPGLIDCHVHVYLSEVNVSMLEHVPVSLLAARAAPAA